MTTFNDPSLRFPSSPQATTQTALVDPGNPVVVADPSGRPYVSDQVASREFVTERHGSGGSLAGLHLSLVDLSHLTLRGADLYGTDMYSCDLRSADLTGANLGGADLRRADLRGACLSGANLRAATLTGVSMDAGTVLEGVAWDEQTSWPADFTPPPSREHVDAHAADPRRPA